MQEVSSLPLPMSSKVPTMILTMLYKNPLPQISNFIVPARFETFTEKISRSKFETLVSAEQNALKL
jgi:hypothetical protein